MKPVWFVAQKNPVESEKAINLFFGISLAGTPVSARLITATRTTFFRFLLNYIFHTKKLRSSWKSNLLRFQLNIMKAQNYQRMRLMRARCIT